VITRAENERLTRIDGDAPMGRLMRAHYWIPFALSSQLVPGAAPMPVRLFGERYVAFRAENGRVGFFEEQCPHRRASLALGRVEGNGIRCIYHGWKIDVAGCVVEAPTQLVRSEQFAARVRVAWFPVHEAGDLVWVWLGAGEAPAFPELPFAEHDLHRYWCVSRMPCNWLQGVEGTIDSAHVNWLHQSWHRVSAERPEYAHLSLALTEAPSYEPEATPYGMRAAALRRMGDGRTYVRVTEHFMPLVTVVPTGRGQPRDGSMFVISPVDDTHHALFFGIFSDTAKDRLEDQRGMTAAGFAPDPLDFAGLHGDRDTRWGQDREIMNAGHWSGFGRNLLEEDAAVQASMGPILDRTKENLTSGDAAVAHARRMLLDALLAAEAGRLPPGSALTPEVVRMPNAVEVVLPAGAQWADAALHTHAE
jgi:phthalate 4,5-dioxygenase